VKHPKAHLRREISLEDALKAPLVAWPLGLFDCCPVSDGAAAAIITTPEKARRLGRPYTLVKGIGLACGARQALLDDAYDMVHFEETVRAAKQAYDQAGIKTARGNKPGRRSRLLHDHRAHHLRRLGAQL